MHTEIKEILDDLKDMNNYSNFIDSQYGGGGYYYLLEKKESKQLLDYITNLQQEINKLTAESTEWESKCYDLQQENERKERLITQYGEGMCAYANRIDKAIEYIDKVKCINDRERDGMHWEYDVFFPELLNILQNGRGIR